MARYAHNPLQIRRGFQALGKLLQNPDDTAQFATVVEAFQGDSVHILRWRMERTPEGRRLFGGKPSLLPALCDHESLRKLPEGTLGRAYLAYCERENISGEGLKDVLEEGYSLKTKDLATPEQVFLRDWMRDTHDLYHLVTGYQTDLVGELCVLTFTVSQTWNAGVLLPVSVAFTMAGLYYPEGQRLAWQAWRRGLKAAFFPVQDWTGLLEKPLEEVRRILKVGGPPQYEPVYTRARRGPGAVVAG